MQGRQERAFAALQEAAARQNIRVYQNAGEITLVPMANGQDLEPEAFQRLPEAQRQQLEAAVVEIRKQLQEIFQRQMPAWRKEAREWFRALNHEVTRDAVGLYMESLSRRYADLPQVLDYLNGVQRTSSPMPSCSGPRRASSCYRCRWPTNPCTATG